MIRFLMIGGALLLAGCFVQDTAAVERSADRNAKAWCGQMGLECSGVSCSGRDSDGDGYVSCSAAVAGDVKAIECGYDMVVVPVGGQNTGCKVAQPKVNIRTSSGD